MTDERFDLFAWRRKLDRTPWQELGSKQVQGHARKAVAGAVASYVDADGTGAFPGFDRLMANTGIGSRHTIAGHLAALTELGWLTRTHKAVRRPGGRDADVYALTFPPDPGQSDTPDKSCVIECTHDCTQSDVIECSHECTTPTHIHLNASDEEQSGPHSWPRTPPRKQEWPEDLDVTDSREAGLVQAMHGDGYHPKAIQNALDKHRAYGW